MHDINLLPRKTFMDKFFIPLVVLTILTIILGSSYQVYQIYDIHAQVQQKRDVISSFENNIKELAKSRHTDAITKDYLDFSEQINTLKETRRDWLSVVDLITTRLSFPSEIIHMNADKDGALTMNLNFTEFNHIADYMTLLQQSPLIQDVNVSSIERREDDNIKYNVKLQLQLTTLLQKKQGSHE